MDQKKHKQLLAQIEKDLASKDVKVVTAALKQTMKHGDASLILPVMRAFRDMEDGPLKDNLRETLCTIKISDAENIYMEALEDEEFASIHGDILYFTWNAGFQPVDAVDLITQKSLEGDYMTGVEGMTLLESMPGPLDEESLMQALVYIRKFLLDHKDSDHPSYSIAISIYNYLSQHEREG